MTQEIIEMAQECGLIGMRPHLDGIYSEALVAFAKLVTERALADPMREVQRLGQEIEPDDMASILACRDMLDAQPVPPRTWVGLTDDDDIDWEEGGNLKDLVKAIEAKLKQKNGFAEEKNTICSPFMISELWKLHK